MPAEDYGHSIVVDCTTGEVTTRPLTPEEVAQRDTEAAIARQEAADLAATALEREERRARLQAALDGGGLDALSGDIVREVLEDR